VSMLEVGGSSLVTVTGPSGVGKTRVASAVARELADDLPGGVIWVDAGPIKNGEDILASIAEAVGLSSGPATLKQALPKTLGERRTLVVLDGLDGIDAKSAIAILLWAGPKVSVIVTSGSTLGLASEQVLALQPLSTSGSDHTVSPAAGFVVAMLDRLGVAPDPSAIQAAVKQTQGLPSELEQVALNLITQSVA
jgi:predicted ATPase